MMVTPHWRRLLCLNVPILAVFGDQDSADPVTCAWCLERTRAGEVEPAAVLAARDYKDEERGR